MAATALVVGLAAGGLGGCTLGPVDIAVAGLDRDGNPVVGGVDCSFGSGRPDEITVTTAGEFGTERVWAISNPLDSYGGLRHDPGSLGDRPSPDPARLDEVTLVAVGEGQPADWDVTTPLRRPLPEVGVLEVAIGDGYLDDELSIDLSDPPDTFSAVVDGDLVDDVDAATLTDRIRAVCDEATHFEWGTFWAIFGPTVGGVLLLATLALLSASRSFRRAGVARARKRAGASSG